VALESGSSHARRPSREAGADVVSRARASGRGACVWTARWIVPTPERWIENGGLVVAGGRVERVLASPRAVARAERAGARRRALEDTHEVDGAILLPGLVNAHAHLDLTGLAGRTPRGAGAFGDWIRAVLAERARRTPAELEADVVRGAERALASGTTTIGDIDSTGAGPRVLGRHALRVVQYREVLDARDPARSTGACREARRRWPARARRTEGLSPHAPFTVSDELLAACGARVREEGLPIAIHWAETPEEREYLLHGRGPLAAVLGPPPFEGTLDRLARAGLLGRRTALVHGNDPARGERERIARAGASLVHCPGSHRFFGRPPFPFAAWRRRGVPVALGTDSLASNDDLDPLREMALLRASDRGLEPTAVLAAATEHGARALGLGRAVGCLTPGAHADAVLVVAEGAGPPELADAVTGGGARVAGVWIAGRRVSAGSR